MVATMKLTLDRSMLEKLLHHAAFAAQLVGHLDDSAHADLVSQIGDHLDAIAHELTEIFGDPRAVAAPDAASDDRVTYDGAPVLAISAGGAR